MYKSLSGVCFIRRQAFDDVSVKRCIDLSQTPQTKRNQRRREKSLSGVCIIRRQAFDDVSVKRCVDLSQV